MFYTPEERDRVSREAPTMYAVLAHEYPCCDLPIVTDCAVCSIDPEKCSNKAEIERALAEAPRTGWLQDGDEKIEIRIPWGIISEVIQYAARDKDGSWWGFFTKPTRGIDSWIGRCWPLDVIKMPITALDWRKTLVERPGQLPDQKRRIK